MTAPNEQQNPSDPNEIVIDPNDLIEVLTEENVQLLQQLSMLKAANRRLRRQLAERDEPTGPPGSDGVPPRLREASHGAR